MIKVGEEIIAGRNERFRVVDVVPIDDEDSPLVGLLQVDAAYASATDPPRMGQRPLT